VADPFLQFIDRKGRVHPSPEAAIAADIENATGFSPAIALGIVQRRDLLKALLAELDNIQLAYGQQIEAQEIDRRARRARLSGDAPRPGEAPGPSTGE